MIEIVDGIPQIIANWEATTELRAYYAHHPMNQGKCGTDCLRPIYGVASGDAVTPDSSTSTSYIFTTAIADDDLVTGNKKASIYLNNLSKNFTRSTN